VALQLFTYLPAQTLLQCALVSRRWRTLADDPFLWKNLCDAREWHWRQPSRAHGFETMIAQTPQSWDDDDDEGMGDSDEEPEGGGIHHNTHNPEDVDVELEDGNMQQHPDDSGFASTSMSVHLATQSVPRGSQAIRPLKRSRVHTRHSAPSILPSHGSIPKANYKLLYQTHIRLRSRFQSASYRLSALQTRGAPTNTHTNTIYCLQLYTYPSSGVQVLFTGSRDRSIREWNLSTGLVERVMGGVHESSVLSVCVRNDLIASAGSDRRVVVWDLVQNKLVKVICDHEDSVLCVRFDDERLVSCSKGL
jgi:WD40 repeat protein